MEKWSPGYAILKLIVKFAFWLSHKNITVIGKENIPYKEPVIFAPNHQNALMDPLAVLCYCRTQPVWLARADIFRSKLARPILRFLKILPVYRIRDGKENLEKNESIFNTAIHILECKKTLGLFPEAAHSGKRQMLAHKKAVPRIAFLAEGKNNFNLNLKVIPVGIYYSHYWHFNRNLLVNYGQPIELANYQSLFKESEYKATMALRLEITDKLEKLILNINNKTHYENFELLRELLSESFAANNKLHKGKNANCFFSDKKLIEILEQKEKEEPDNFKELHNCLDRYRELLETNQLNDQKVNLGIHANWTFILKTMVAILLLPFLATGTILLGIPFWGTRLFLQGKVMDTTFLSTFQFVSGLIVFPVFLLIIAIIILIAFHNIGFAILFFFGSLLIGKVAYLVLEFWEEILHISLYHFHKKRRKELFLTIEQNRATCIQLAMKFIN